MLEVSRAAMMQLDPDLEPDQMVISVVENDPSLHTGEEEEAKSNEKDDTAAKESDSGGANTQTQELITMVCADCAKTNF